MRLRAWFTTVARLASAVTPVISYVVLLLYLSGGIGSVNAAAFVSFELIYPAGQGIDRATIGASGGLKIAPDVRILGEDGSPGSITNAGLEAGSATAIFDRATVGAIISLPNILISPNVTAANVTSGGIVTSASGANVGSVTQGAELRPLVRKTIVAHADGDAASDAIVASGGTRSLAAGQYRNVTIGPNATLQMTAGTYIVDRFSLGENARLQLDTGGGTIDVYVRESASWQGTSLGDTGRFVFAFLGAGELTLTGGFRGTALVPSGILKLGLDGSGGTYEGTFYGRHVLTGPKIVVRKQPLPLFGADLEGCAARVPIRTDLPPDEREVAYQGEIARLCSMPGLSSCRAYLVGRTNVDYTAAAARMVTGSFSPAEYLATVRDRTRKLRAAEDNSMLAMLLCTAPDADSDGVVDANDRCPNTPDLTATDDNGCPLATLPPAPSREDVLKVFLNLDLAINPRCRDAPVPSRVPAGAFYWPAFRERGTYILSGAVLNQPAGCPVWYEFDIKELGGPRSGERFSVVFMDREANLNLVELGRPVPEGFIQFNPRPGAVGSRDRLATIGGVAGIRYRVRAMNGNGVRGPWSDYKISDRASCTALGFQCGGG